VMRPVLGSTTMEVSLTNFLPFESKRQSVWIVNVLGSPFLFIVYAIKVVNQWVQESELAVH
jgi:hypothetical protein